MEIMRRTPWSRIREQNSVYKEFLEIVGNGKPTGSALKETIAVSATIWISVEKLHHQIRLRILSRGRMSENHREPEVPEEKVPVVECLDGHARITSRNLHQFILWKMAPSRMHVLQDQEWLSVWGKVLLRTSSGWWTTLWKVQKDFLDRQRQQILADRQAEIRKHEFQTDYDRRSIQKLSETIESQQEELHRA